MKNVVAVALLFLLPVASAAAQRDRTAFSIFIENDTFSPQGSDTAYTNGLRLAWSINRYRPGMRLFTDYNVAQIFRVAPLRGLGLLPKRIDPACQSSEERSKRKIEQDTNPVTRQVVLTGGACTILNIGIAQVMYTPDSLASTAIEVHQRPYAGFLYSNFGVTTIDSPRATDSTHWLSFTEVSNQVLIGITGQGSLAEDTQALAHWTWSTGAHRPMGWNNQLRQRLQVGLISDLLFRPHFLERCNRKAGCNGLETERRVADLTPHLESIIGTYMVRVSAGATARLGARFPDAVGTLRIPVSRNMGDGGKRCIVCERLWYYGFVNAETRRVPYNMFISGGLGDDGPTGWRTIRQITPRHAVHELAFGAAAGHTRFSARWQLAWRTAEYDVIGRPHTNGWHGYGSMFVAIHSPPESR